MRTMLFVVAALAAFALTGCAGTNGQNVDMTGSLCVGGICISAPRISQAAPEVPTVQTYNAAMAVSSPVAVAPAHVIGVAPAVPVQAVPVRTAGVACQAVY